MLSPKIRVATSADAPEIERLLHMMHAEGGMFELDMECARAMFARAFDKRGGIIGVIGAGDSIEAMIYLLITRQWYTYQHHLEEVFNYVRPDCRKSNHARDLIGFAKNCSDELKLPLVIGVLTNIRIAPKVRLYQRELGLPAGAFFVFNGKWVNQNPETEQFWKQPFPAHSERKNGRARA